MTDTLVKDSILEIRKALEDNAKAPQFIATVHRRGYRFIGKISSQRSAVSRQQLETRNLQLETHLVGREAELAQLQRWLGKAMIEKQIEQLSPKDQRVLEVGSVAGAEFSTAAVAAGLGAEVGEIEEQCEGLVARSIPAGEWHRRMA